jgi:hypothetical protein
MFGDASPMRWSSYDDRSITGPKSRTDKTCDSLYEERVLFVELGGMFTLKVPRKGP